MFHVGQRVECVNDEGWFDDVLLRDCSGPSYGDVVVVTGVSTDPNFGPTIFITGWEGDYITIEFRPLTEDPKAVRGTVAKHFSHHLREGERV